MFRLARITPALWVFLLFTTSPLSAQCGGVQENGCTISGVPACWIVGGLEFGSIEWPHSSGCLAECPPAEHCSSGFAQELSDVGIAVSELASVIMTALDRNDQQRLRDVFSSTRITFSAERRAIQVYGCSTDVVIGHLRIPEGLLASVRTAQIQQQRLAAMSID